MSEAFPIARTPEQAAAQERARNTRLYSDYERLREAVESLRHYPGWLRAVAAEAEHPHIRKFGWANTCNEAAAAIDAALAAATDSKAGQS